MTRETIRNRLAACGIPLTEAQAEQLLAYHALLLDWNARMDLIAPSPEEEILDRHYADSLMPLTIPGLLPAEGRYLDVGTGAGLPGIPLAILLPEARFTLLDAQEKRLRFLQTVVDALGLRHVTLLHARAEDIAHDPAHRDRYDVVTARAVAPLNVLAEYLLPFAAPGGFALCWKGPALEEELEAGRRAAFVLGGAVGDCWPVPIPGRDWQHQLLRLVKTKLTPRPYPRKAGLPKKSPLGQS